MTTPQITFYCEQEADGLKDLLTHAVISDLSSLGAQISLGIMDFSTERAEAARILNKAGIPVSAWLLLPKSQGYWFNLENSTQALEIYDDFKAWTARFGLEWAGVGLDFEPDIRDVELLDNHLKELLIKAIKRVPNHLHLRRAKNTYRELISRIRSDGYLVESYQLPFILDERKLHSSLLQRVAGLVDLITDKEVIMLYSSNFRPLGPGILWSYGAEAQAIGVGSTGGGVDLKAVARDPLSWDELARDLRLAWVFSNDIYIFSLEGCVQQGYLEKLKNFEWDLPLFDPVQLATRVEGWRRVLQGLLWLSANRFILIASTLGLFILIRKLRKAMRKSDTSNSASANDFE